MMNIKKLKIKVNYLTLYFLLILFLCGYIKNDLIIMGYSKDIINEVLNNTYIEENDDVIEMEFKKEYKKLSRKYSDKELNNKLKYNLYKKGFSLTKIEELINKY